MTVQLYRKNAAGEALAALEKCDKIAKKNRLDREDLEIEKKKKAEARKFDKAHGLVGASVSKRIRFIQDTVLKTPEGHILSTLSPRGRGLGATPKRSPRKTHGHQQCSQCQGTCVRLYDTTRSTAQKIIWIFRVKCIKCGLEQPLKKEE